MKKKLIGLDLAAACAIAFAMGSVAVHAGTLYWNGGNIGTWDGSTANWKDASGRFDTSALPATWKIEYKSTAAYLNRVRGTMFSLR